MQTTLDKFIHTPSIGFHRHHELSQLKINPRNVGTAQTAQKHSQMQNI